MDKCKSCGDFLTHEDEAAVGLCFDCLKIVAETKEESGEEQKKQVATAPLEGTEQEDEEDGDDTCEECNAELKTQEEIDNGLCSECLEEEEDEEDEEEEEQESQEGEEE